MLVKEQNDYLTQTGPGTPMGPVFPQLLDPGAARSELAEPDCPPVRIQLLSERLVAFRDTEGRLGLIEEFCAHRRVSAVVRPQRGERAALSLSWVEIRRDGACIDIPSELPG